MLTIYGPARSRASRALWMLNECDIPFEHEDLARYATMDEKSAALRAVHPLGKVPVLRDGELTLSESMAINLYLAQHHGKHLWPSGAQDQGKVLQWSFFAVTEVDPPLVQLMIERSFRKEPDRDPANEEKNAERIKRPLNYLNDYLANRQYLLGGDFTVADLNLASIFSMAGPAKLDLGDYPNVQAWLSRCQARPAYQKANAPKA